MIRTVNTNDAERIAEIYNYYVEHTDVTFDEKPVTVEEIRQKIADVCAKYPYFVYEKNSRLIGYAYINAWRPYPAYGVTAETSIYIDPKHAGKGFGTNLYETLIEKSREINIHSLIAVLSVPNDSSRKLHDKLGFRQAGCFRETGFKFNRLIDVEFWQKIL
jgi:phosphinothricin acetyltransferase